MELIIMTISFGLFVFLITIIIISALTKNRILINNRIDNLTSGNEQKILIPSVKKKKTRRLSVSKVFAKELSVSGIRMRPEEFLILWLISSLLPCIVLIIAGFHPISITAVTLLGVALPPLTIRRRKGKQLAIFDKQLGDALVLIGNCLRSGLTFQQSLINIANDMKDPIAREFSRAVREIHLGSSLENALNNMVNRVQSTDLMLTVSAVQIQHQVGGNMLEILTNISNTIKERQKLKDDIKVMTATGRISGVIVGLIPIVIGGMLMLINPEYIQLFFNTTIGIALLVTAGLMEFIGFVIIKKIVTIKY